MNRYPKVAMKSDREVVLELKFLLLPGELTLLSDMDCPMDQFAYTFGENFIETHSMRGMFEFFTVAFVDWPLTTMVEVAEYRRV